MVKLDNEKIDSMYREISEFGEFMPGMKYGYDFTEFALALLGSKAFEHWQEKMIADSVVLPILVQQSGVKQPDPKDDEAVKAFRELVMKKSPHKATLLKAMYLGFKLGKAENSGEQS